MNFKAATMLASVLIFAVASSVPTQTVQATVDKTGTTARDACHWLTEQSSNVKRFSALPGGGWDNLRNKDMGQVAEISFNDCKLSDDGTYALPRNIILLARKESSVEVMSEMMENFDEYKSTVSRSINAEASTQFLGISGKLSDEFQQVKSVAVSSKLKIGRAQLRYRLYTAKLQPDFELSSAFVGRISDIVSAIASNRTKLARYLSDLVVRDFGTHVITSVEAGGVLEKIDFINTNAFKSHDSTDSKLSATMSLSFFSFLKMSAAAEYSAATGNVAEYQKSVSKMLVRSHGGPVLGADPSLKDWLNGLKENLVHVDRDGEPLHAVIGRRSLPGVPMVYLLQLRKEIEAAVLRYYSANTIKGCQDPNSRNFDPAANLNGQCESPATNYSFAGVYQTCTETRPHLGACSDQGAQLRNPITGSFECPQGYEEVPLLTIAGPTRTECTRRTKTCWLFFTCTDDDNTCEESASTLRAFWCAARKGARLRPHSGMVFGGAYSTSGRFINPVTEAATCRELFKAYRIGRDIVLCLSMDLHSAARYRLPLAGFFSCNSGNPLAEPNRGLVASSRGARISSRPETPSESLKRCPEGFSQVTLDTVDGCAVMQCVKGRSGFGSVPVRRPPFEEPDSELIEQPVTRVESHGWHWGYNVSSNSWSFLGFYGQGYGGAMRQLSDSSGPSWFPVSAAVLIAAVGCLTVVVVFVPLVVLIAQKRASLASRSSRGFRNNKAGGSGGFRSRPFLRRTAYGAAETDELLEACSVGADDDNELPMDEEVLVTSCRRALPRKPAEK